MKKLRRIYTQNIDCLEVAAGIPENLIVNCHGSFATASCQQCKRKIRLQDYKEVVLNRKIPLCPFCNNGQNALDQDQAVLPSSILKPDIVFFGEKLPDDFVNYIDDDSGMADLLVVMGSTLKVKPIAGLVQKVSRLVPQILINKEHVAGQHQFDFELLGNCENAIAYIMSKLGMGEIITQHNQELTKQQERADAEFKIQQHEYEELKREYDTLEKLLLSKEIQDQLPSEDDEAVPPAFEEKFQRHTELQLMLQEIPKLKQFIQLTPERLSLNDAPGKGVFKVTDATSYVKGRRPKNAEVGDKKETTENDAETPK